MASKSLQTLLLLSLLASCSISSTLPRLFQRSYSTPGLLRSGYHTEPDFKPQKIHFEYLTNDTSQISNEYIFLALMLELGMPWGPQIYDAEGNLVWFGSSISYGRVQDFKLCDYLDSKDSHLCWSERQINREGDHPISRKVFVDNTYKSVQNVSTRGDGHEFKAVDDGRAFLTMDFKHRQRDLRPYFGPEQGWIKDACLLEYNATDGRLNFEWCYSDHLPLWESTLFFPDPDQHNTTAKKFGHGLVDSPWDFAHMNSIDKNSEGDYLASLRHLDQVLKIAGPNSASGKEPGTVLWRLGGKAKEFNMDFSFSKQHDARYVGTDASETHITLFNNAWEGVNEPIASASSGQIISINNDTMEAHLLQEYVNPHGKLSGSRGSMQVLDNGNAFIGWGEHPEFTEFAPDGTPLYHGTFAMNSTGQFSYRAFKFPWLGRPTSRPKLVVYSHQCLSANGPMFAYVSWNGATEVKRWRLRTAMRATGPWTVIGTFRKAGFETRMKISSPMLFAQVDALDANGTVLGHVIQKAFVPQLDLKLRCKRKGCPPHTGYDQSRSRAEQCSPAYLPGLIPLLAVLVCMEIAGLILRRISSWHVEEGVFIGEGWQTLGQGLITELRSLSWRKQEYSGLQEGRAEGEPP